MGTWHGASDLMLAIRYKDERQLEKIILSGAADCDQSFRLGGIMKPVITLCVESRSVGLVKLLLSLGCSPNQTDSEGFTPLHAAVRYNDSKIVKLLLEHGADPNRLSCSARNHTGITPLHVAVGNANIELVRVLLFFGADANKCDSYGQTTPLRSAPVTAGNEFAPHVEKMVQLLFCSGAKIPPSVTPSRFYSGDAYVYNSGHAVDPLLVSAAEAIGVRVGPMTLKRLCRRAIVHRAAIRKAAVVVLPGTVVKFLRFELN